MKNVYAWFWVRSSSPKKVWNKCMDYKVTTENGDTIWYKLLDGNPTPEKVKWLKLYHGSVGFNLRVLYINKKNVKWNCTKITVVGQICGHKAAMQIL